MKFKLAFLLVLLTNISFAQDLIAARKMIDTLTSPFFWGRGYSKHGVTKAADYLCNQYQLYGLKPINSTSFFQYYSFPVNTFPGEMKVSINGRALQPGRDFIVSPESRGVKAKVKLFKKDSLVFVNKDKHVLLTVKDKLTWSVAQRAADYTSVIVLSKALKKTPQTIDLNIENKVINDFQSANICGMVPGTTVPDSMIVFTAHYDHLGGMGNSTFFPGANDNASGVALLLNLAKYYAANPQKYSMVFLCFSGEEAGLLGSKYFTENPLLDLSKIRFLINTDLAGTGEQGITVVNATEFKKEFALLNKVNNHYNYLNKINSRGKAANSDHYWFTQKGVPSFFIYTMGGIKAYHDIYDRAATLPLTEFQDLFRLITKFNAALLE